MVKSLVIYAPVSGSLIFPRYPIVFLEYTESAIIEDVEILYYAGIISKSSIFPIREEPISSVLSSHDPNINAEMMIADI